MSSQSQRLHELRSALSLVKMRLELGGYSREILVRELEEAMALLAELESPAGALEEGARVDDPVRVVIADDDPRLADVLARRLRREGLTTRSAHDLTSVRGGASASGGGSEEVVIVDLSLLSAATEEERAWAASIRPLVVTGASSQEAERRLEGIRPYAIVQKPFSSQQLASLARRRAAEARE